MLYSRLLVHRAYWSYRATSLLKLLMSFQATCLLKLLMSYRATSLLKLLIHRATSILKLLISLHRLPCSRILWNYFNFQSSVFIKPATPFCATSTLAPKHHTHPHYPLPRTHKYSQPLLLWTRNYVHSTLSPPPPYTPTCIPIVGCIPTSIAPYTTPMYGTNPTSTPPFISSQLETHLPAYPRPYSYNCVHPHLRMPHP